MFQPKPHKENGTKGVAPVIGFLLVMAIIFLAAGQYQANVVPVQERQEEANHFNKLEGDISGLRTDIIKSSSNGQLQSQKVQLGMTYDTLGVTHTPVSGTLSLNTTQSNLPRIKISNAENNGIASNYWTGDQDRKYHTSILSYKVDYNRFAGNPDLFMEHGYIYRDTIKDDDTNINMIPVSEQPIINSNQITLYTLRSGELAGPTSEGDSFSVNQVRPATVEVNPTSAPMKSVSITNNEDSESIIIKIPTRLTQTQWNDILENQISEKTGTPPQCVDSQKHVKGVSNVAGENAVEITMCKGITYNLRMSRIDIQTRSNRGLIPPTDKQYIAVDNDQVVNIRENTVINIQGEVRDRYNNGVVGVSTIAEAKDTRTQDCVGDFDKTPSGTSPQCDNTGQEQPGLSVSDAQGDISFVYESPPIDNDQQVTFSYRFLN